MPCKTKVNEDEKIVYEICEKLNKLVKKIVYLDPSFVYTGSKEKGYYTIYNKNNYGKSMDLSLNFRLYYPDKESFYYDTQAKHLKSTDLNEYIESKYNDSKLIYAKIEWFSVNPTSTGTGSRLIVHFIEILKHIENIEFILLCPKNNTAKNFWSRNKFVEEDYYIKLDKRVKNTACKRLVYNF